MRSTDSLMSRPCPAIAASVNRSASAPCFAVMSSGSMTLPFVFDIFSPFSSRTMAWRKTVLNGTSPMKCRPIMALRGLLARDRDVSVRAVPRRDLVSPPQLPRDAPVVDVGHPAQELGAPVLRHEAHVVDVSDDLVRERPRLDEPLLGQERLDDVR